MGLKKIPDLTHDTTPSAISTLETDRGGASFYNILTELLAQTNSLLPINLSVVASVAASALTLAVKSAATGNNPSATDPVYIPVRSVTRGIGKIIMVPVTSALSIVIPSSATLGHSSGVDSQIILYALNSGSDASPVLELAVSSAYTDQSARFQSSTTISSGATSSTTIYSTTGRSTVPMTPIARSIDNQTAAGTWAATPLQIDAAPFTVPVLTTSPITGGPLTPGGGPIGFDTTVLTSKLLNTLTASNSATLVDTTSISATYKLYMIVLSHIVPATNNTGLMLRFSEDGGSTYKTTTYISEICGGIGASSLTFRAEGATGEILLSGINVSFDGINNSATYGLHGVIYLHDPAFATGRKMVTGTVGWTGGGATPGRSNMGTVTGIYDGDSGAVNALQFSMVTGNITSGTIKIYGIL